MSDINETLRKAKERMAQMSKEELDEMFKKQRESFARAMMPCEHGVYDFEDCPECRGKTE